MKDKTSQRVCLCFLLLLVFAIAVLFGSMIRVPR